MELKSFVAQALVEIVQGVTEAQKQTKELGALVNPLGLIYPVVADQRVILSKANRDIRQGQIVEFDVSVSASEKDAAQGGIGIQVASITIGAGLSGSSEEQNSTISRLRFSIPLFLPESD